MYTSYTIHCALNAQGGKTDICLNYHGICMDVYACTIFAKFDIDVYFMFILYTYKYL